MAKFMVLYSSEQKASEVMANATPEQMKAGMDTWIRWRGEAEKKLKVDFGMPLEAVGAITSNGPAESTSRVSGYSIIEGDKDAVMDILKTHPHLQQPGNSIDVLEMLPMPGLDV